MNFIDKVLKDGAPTEAGVEAMELVYESLDMGCWHKGELSKEISTIENFKWKCNCGETVKGTKWRIVAQIHCNTSNPALLTSLDAWMPLWEMMIKHKDPTKSQQFQYSGHLHEIVCPEAFHDDHDQRFEAITAKPHHHLEAALRTLEVECSECDGEYKSHNPAYPDCTCTNGKRTLYEIWEGTKI